MLKNAVNGITDMIFFFNYYYYLDITTEFFLRSSRIAWKQFHLNLHVMTRHLQQD